MNSKKIEDLTEISEFLTVNKSKLNSINAEIRKFNGIQGLKKSLEETFKDVLDNSSKFTFLKELIDKKDKLKQDDAKTTEFKNFVDNSETIINILNIDTSNYSEIVKVKIETELQELKQCGMNYSQVTSKYDVYKKKLKSAQSEELGENAPAYLISCQQENYEKYLDKTGADIQYFCRTFHSRS